MNPGLELMRPPGTRVSDEVLATAKRIADYSADRIRKPSKIMEDAKRIRAQMRRDLDPAATPAAPTFAGELRRNFDVGMHQGELAFDIGSLFVGGPGAKVVGRLAEARTLATPEKFLKQGFSQKQAEYLAEPYPPKDMGHHFWPRGQNPPAWFEDSVFNVKRPPDISRGDFYELHSKIDRSYHHANLPARVGGGGWNAKALGVEKYNLPGRLWFGSPGPLKARVGGSSLGAGGLMNTNDRE
jgi:hypothetical protein